MRKTKMRGYSFIISSCLLAASLGMGTSCATDPVGTGLERGLDTVQRSIDRSRGLEAPLITGDTLKEMSRWIDAAGGSGIRATVVKDAANSKEIHYWLCLQSDALPGLRMYAPVDEKLNEPFADFSAATFFCNYDDGWASFDMPLSGRITLEKNGDAITLKSDSGIERLPVHTGKLRAGNKIIAGEQAVSALRNRQERNAALADFMREKKAAAPSLPWLDTKAKGSNEKKPGFRSVAQAFLFPETVGKSYTETVFPENLRALRQNGTLYRDWIESGPWIYAEFNWPDFNQELARGITLTEKRK